jgi:hypothetical protein
VSRRNRHDHPWFVWLALGVDPLTAALLLSVERPRPDTKPGETRRTTH